MSTRVVVWSERDEPFGDHRWRDCTYSSYLMALAFGGLTAFKLGIYTAAEREAFERSDSRPDETGSNLNNTDEAATKRYGPKYKLVAPTDNLAIALTKVGTALVVQGVNSRLSTYLRRWDASFTGNHCVCVIPVGGGKSRWLDPLATWKYEGDIVDNIDILKWAFGQQYTRVVKADVFAPPAPVIPTFHAGPGVYTTYAIVNGRAKAVGTLPTKGFRAQYKILKAIQSDGTGTTTLLQVTSGLPAPFGYRGKILYRYTPGISIIS